MALRRSIGSLSSVLNNLRGLALSECSSAAAACAQQQHAAPTLVSLRSFWPASAPATCGSSPAAMQALAGGCRRFAAASTPPAQQQAAATAAAEGQEESLEQIRSRIFGTHIGNGLRSGRKVLRKALMGQKLMDYYPPDPVKHDPLMLDVAAENAKLKLDRLRRRGKAPPKKGAGKRASKKK